MRLIQFGDSGRLAVACVLDVDTVERIDIEGGVYALAQGAVHLRSSLADFVDKQRKGPKLHYQQLIDEKRLLPPIVHPNPAHLLVTGTGLTHLGSANSRAAMHAKLAHEESLTDSMKMFKLGVEGGKPAQGVGVQPEWFYKGDGDIVVAPEQSFHSPGFAQDAGEEPEMAGLYIVDNSGHPWRVGFALGNEFSDHMTERFNYLWLAHSKLRQCSFGPELLLGEAPDNVQGMSRIVRSGRVLWEKAFQTGEANMSHTIANLEHHHFKYAQFRRPGDVHVHFFGTGTLSFADGVKTEAGDQFEVEHSSFGRALRNPLVFDADAGPVRVGVL